MTRALEYTRAAVSDLEALWSWIDSPEAAAAYARDLRDAIDHLRTFPDLGRARDDLGAELRTLAVRRHLVVYRYTDSAVTIVRVVSGYRDLDALL